MKLFNFKIGKKEPFFLIAGPCVVESKDLAIETAGILKEITNSLGINLVYKSSFDKANRTSINGFRSIGIDKSLFILSEVKKIIKIPILSDVHEYTDLNIISDIVDYVQTPALLCRQTSFLEKVAKINKPINIKKGQFLSPWDMKYVVEKVKKYNNNIITVCERGTCFGYNNLIADMRSIKIMQETNCPIIFDASHSVQLPSALGNKSSGQKEFIPILSRAAVAIGISGLFIETHPNPKKALSDGNNSWPLNKMKKLLSELVMIDKIIKRKI